MKHTPRKEFIAGIKAELPILVGVIPFGMIYGVLALSAGIPAGAAQAMSAIIFAGSSQILVTQLVHQAAPAIVIILTVGVVNIRHALYSASVAPYVHKLRPAWKWILAYLLTDEAYAVTILHYQNDRDETVSIVDRKNDHGIQMDESKDDISVLNIPQNYKHFFFLGAGLALWSSWQLSTAAGILLGAVVPASWSLDFTLALTFIALVVPNLKDKASLGAALSAGIVAVIAYQWQYKLGLLVAAMTGILVGILIENYQTSKAKEVF